MRVLTFLLTVVFGWAGTASAAQPPEPEFPILGGSFGQIMRVTVAAGSQDACHAAIRFQIGDVAPPDPERTLDLAPGEVGVADLALSRLAPRFGMRVEVRPRVDVLAGRCSAAVETFELFTRRTTAYLRLFTGLAQPPEPDRPVLSSPPDPDFPPIATASGQMLRLGVARTVSPPEPEVPGTINPPDPDKPCRGTLAFFDARGIQVGNSARIALLPNQFTFADFDPRSLGASAPIGRMVLQPRLIADGDGSVAGCHASVQLFDAATGWTTEVVAGR